MFIKGKSVSLRALEPADASLLYSWENDLSLWQLSLTQVPFSKFVLEEFVNSAVQDIYTNKQLRLMVCDIHSQKVIGMIDLFDFEAPHARAGLGIFIHNDHRKRGAATESIQLMLKYAFEILYLKQVHVQVQESNTASIALFEKVGFVQTGIKKCWIKSGLNAFEDVLFMQCINN